MAITEIHILHHTHIDVGYTDLQPEIWDKHLEYLDNVLDYCTRTDSYPQEAQFRWVCEFSWPMISFFQKRPERAKDMIERLCQGRIELAGLFLDPTELMDKRAYEISLQPALQLAHTYGFEVKTVMTTDIPGMGWSLPDVMDAHNVPYLSVSPNAMVSLPLQLKSTDCPFWWIGPQGGKALVWHTDWRKGWYGACHVLGLPQGMEVFGPKLREYLQQLEEEGYPYNVFLLHYAADNYPPDATVSDLVAMWNEEVGEPVLWLSTNRMFFERLIERHGESFPEYQLAWPDWWSNGLGSAAYETALSRETHCRLRRIEALQDFLRTREEDLWPLWEDLLFFDEHTWGCSNMALEPHSFRSRASWIFKAQHIYRAADRARRVEERLTRLMVHASERADSLSEDFRDQSIHTKSPKANQLALFNPLSAPFWGPVLLPPGCDKVGSLRIGQRETVPVQFSPATQLRPAQCWTILNMEPNAGIVATVEIQEQAEAKINSSPNQEFLRLETAAWRCEWAPNGPLLGLWDKAMQKQWIDLRAPWGFGEIIREIITSPGDRCAVWERGYTDLPYGKRRRDANFLREGSLSSSRLIRWENGPLAEIALFEAHLPSVCRIEIEYRLWKNLPWLELEIRLDKQAYECYESLYVAFPFALQRPRAFVHSCDAVFEAEAGQLPGTCRDFYYVQDFVALAGEDGWTAICPVQAPLVQLGAITFGRWAEHLQLERACVYSWLTNNFWYTNFPGYQLGEFTFRYAIAAGPGAFVAHEVQHIADIVRTGLAIAYLA